MMGEGAVRTTKELQQSEQFKERMFASQIYLGDMFHGKLANLSEVYRRLRAGEVAW